MRNRAPLLAGRPGGEQVLFVPESRKPFLGYLLAALAATCWALNALTAKWLFTRFTQPVQPLQLAAVRACLSALTLIVFLALTRRRLLHVRLRQIPFLIVFGVLGLALLHFTYFKAIENANVATALLLQYCAPVMVFAVSVAFLGERLTWSLPTAVGLSVFGCALTVGAVGGEGLAVSSAGIFWGLISAAFFAAYTLMGKWASTRYRPLTLVTHGLAWAAVFWLIYLRGPGPVLHVLSSRQGVLAALFVAVVGTVLPFAAYLTSLHLLDATKVSVTATLEPAIAGVGAYLVFAESMTALQILGGCLVLAAIVVVQLPARDSTAQAEVLSSLGEVKTEAPVEAHEESRVGRSGAGR